MDFADGYAKVLASAEARGEVSPGDAEVRAWALMGVADMVGRRFAIWDDRADLTDITDAAFAFIVQGIGPRPT
jgi:hypothetical protein